MKYKMPALLIAGALIALSADASTVTFALTVDGCTGGCGAGPYGNITLTDNGTASVMVIETLSPGLAFVGTGAGDALEFNVDKAVTISGFTDGFGIGPSPDKASVFGTFGYSATCLSCTGSSSTLPGPLAFTVTAQTGTLSIADFVANSHGYYFASDILGGVNTGNVAALAPTSATPEPSTMALAGVLLVGLGLTKRRKAA